MVCIFISSLQTSLHIYQHHNMSTTYRCIKTTDTAHRIVMTRQQSDNHREFTPNRKTKTEYTLTVSHIPFEYAKSLKKYYIILRYTHNKLQLLFQVTNSWKDFKFHAGNFLTTMKDVRKRRVNRKSEWKNKKTNNKKSHRKKAVESTKWNNKPALK